MAFRILRVVLDSAARMRAQYAVKAAVKMGRLPNLKRKFVQCADCEARATAYDHRHYAEPLKVEPVCTRCNRIRGFAADQTFKDAITGEPRTERDYRAERCKTVRVAADRILSAITGKPDYLKEGGERADWRRMTMRGRALRAWERRREYLNAEHEYALTRGRVDTGQRKRMTGLEAKRLNQGCERAFMSQLDTDKTKRLYRWVMAVHLRKAA